MSIKVTINRSFSFSWLGENCVVVYGNKQFKVPQSNQELHLVRNKESDLIVKLGLFIRSNKLKIKPDTNHVAIYISKTLTHIYWIIFSLVIMYIIGINLVKFTTIELIISLGIYITLLILYIA